MIPSLSERFQKLWFRVIKRAAASPNAQTCCERANSDYDQFKSKHAVRMKLPMIRARLRIKINGPPLSKFKPAFIRKLWLQKQHQYAVTASEQKVVIGRIRTKAEEYI